MYSTITHDAALTRDILASLGKSWDQRVAVRKDRLDLDQYYDPSIPDFPVSLVPFWDDEDFAGLALDVKQRMLAAAWIAYNEKAIYLEEAIVQPACGVLFRAELPGVGDPRVKQVIAQIQVDEQFHILMCLDICHVSRVRHQLLDYVFPEPALGIRLKELVRSSNSADNARIAQLAYASVAEMSINAYLDVVALDTTIQPLNRINTDMHRRDEAAHGIGFSEIVGSVYRRMTTEQKTAFRHYMSVALHDFTSPDTSHWASILEHLDIPNRDKIMRRQESSTRGMVLKRDYSTLRRLFDELGITESIDFSFS